MVEVNPNLLGAMVQIIDVASSKGAFTGQDISAVGDVRKELVGILQPLQEAAQAANDGMTEVSGSELPGDQKPN